MPYHQTTARQHAAELSPGRRRAVLVVVSLALMTVVSAVTGLNVALPDLAVDTGASQTQLTWIVDAYTVVFAGLLLPAGALGDRFGRRGILTAGLVVFGAASALVLGVHSPGPLVALRALMGLGAAGIMPATLSIITTSFPPAERGKAVGIWVGVAGGGAVIGLFASGLLLEFFGWSSFFVLNVALALLAVGGTLAVVPGSRDEHASRLDPGGALLSMLGIGGLVFGIIEGPERGWSDPLTVTALAGGTASLVGFVLWELRTDEPLLDPRLFALRGFSSGTAALTAQFFATFGLFFVVLQYLQFVVGQSPLRAAVSLLPLPIVLLPIARVSPRLVQRFGPDRVVPTGLAMSGSGMVLLSFTGVELVYWRFALGLALFAAGAALAQTPSTDAIVASLPAHKQGVGSAMNDVSRELGSALGIAILGSVLTSGYTSGVRDAFAGAPPELAARAGESISFVRLGQEQLGQLGAAGQVLADAARQSFVDAIGTAFLVAAGVLLLSAVAITLLALGRRQDPVAGPAAAQVRRQRASAKP